jgi:myo-inositol-1(or 4)-monophosphatase
VSRQGGVTSRERLAEIALEVAREAGQLAHGGFRQRMQVTEKGKYDLVTAFDLSVERKIRERLATLTPDLPVVGEEEGGDIALDRAWFCDPIDGTTNFAHGHPVWAVSIGAVLDGEPVAGAIVAPALSLEWFGHVGGGAWRNGEACHVSSVSDVEHALIATGFPRERSREPDNNFATFAKVKKKCQGVRRCGAAAIDLAFVADGTYDAYWERKLAPWDLAAGVAIVTAAGGRVSHLGGGPVQLTNGQVLADNGTLHEVLLGLLAD